jgi:hypothetical protein
LGKQVGFLQLKLLVKRSAIFQIGSHLWILPDEWTAGTHFLEFQVELGGKKRISQDVAGTIIASLHACYLLFLLLILVFRVDCNEIKISCLLNPGFGKIDPALVTTGL